MVLSGSLMGSILAMDHYQDVFNTGMDGPKVSVVTSLYTVYELPLSALTLTLEANMPCFL